MKTMWELENFLKRAGCALKICFRDNEFSVQFHAPRDIFAGKSKVLSDAIEFAVNNVRGGVKLEREEVKVEKEQEIASIPFSNVLKCHCGAHSVKFFSLSDVIFKCGHILDVKEGDFIFDGSYHRELTKTGWVKCLTP